VPLPAEEDRHRLTASTPADEPDRLHGLHERGTLTDVEIQVAKERILA
jgi:hypothetical protein